MIRWVSILYQDIQTAVINNGFMTICFDDTIIGCSSEANICVLGTDFRKWSNNFDRDVFKDCELICLQETKSICQDTKVLQTTLNFTSRHFHKKKLSFL